MRPDEDATWESVIWKETDDYYSYQLTAGGEEAGVPEGVLAEEEGVGRTSRAKTICPTLPGVTLR